MSVFVTGQRFMAALFADVRGTRVMDVESCGTLMAQCLDALPVKVRPRTVTAMPLAGPTLANEAV